MVSIRAPRFHTGRPGTSRRLAAGPRVSIRAPRFHTGRPGGRLPAWLRAFCFNPRPALSHGATSRADQSVGHRRRFQSAPRAFTRGDGVVYSQVRWTGRFNPRPALSHGATLKLPLDFVQRVTVSIRAPRFHTGRQATSVPVGHSVRVSIRAPRFHTGRLEGGGLPPSPFPAFQSAPRAFTRGDGGTTPTTDPRRGFQSAPRAFTRGDRAVLRLSIRRPCRFNPRPALSHGATLM